MNSRQRFGVPAKFRAIQGDVSHQYPQLVVALISDADGNDVGGRTTTIDVPTYRMRRGDRLKLIKQGQVSDVACVQDQIRFHMPHLSKGIWVRDTMGVGDDRNANRFIAWASDLMML